MRRALELAERGGGATSPNPMVGCVLVDAAGSDLGEGFHRQAGGPHAEVVVLEAAREAGREARGATAVVSLEPCAAPGRTPACVDALVAAGVARVVFAAPDPHTGRGGADRLRAAGVDVKGGVLEDEARRLNEPWLHSVETGVPFFHLKVAQTLNAMVTRGRLEPRWVTGPEARAEVHRMRRRHRAVLIGVGTLLEDDPRLTVREAPPGWPDVQPVRIVLDTNLRTPPHARLFESGGGPVWIFAGEQAPAEREAALTARGAEVLRVGSTRQGVSLLAVRDALAEREVTGVLVEPGPSLATAFVESGLIDRWTAFVAPDWVTRAGALPLLLSAAPHTSFSLSNPTWTPCGRDAAVSGRFIRPVSQEA